MRLLSIYLVLYCISVNALFAQHQKTVLLNYALEPSPNQWSVKFEEVLTKRDTVWSVERYAMPQRNLVAEYAVFDTSSQFKHGLFKAYHLNGQLSDSGLYVEGYKKGWHYSWYNNGNLSSKTKFKNGIPIDTCTTWDEDGRITTVSILKDNGNGFRRDVYPNQQLKAFGPMQKQMRYGRWKFFDEQQRKVMEVQFDNGYAKNTICFDTLGNLISTPCIFEKGPEYEGGSNAFTRFLQNNVVWPDEAKVPGGKGRVVVSFLVHLDGTIGEFEILETAHPLLSAEALRILKLSGKWNPAIFMNQPAEWRFTENIYIAAVKPMQQ